VRSEALTEDQEDKFILFPLIGLTLCVLFFSLILIAAKMGWKFINNVGSEVENEYFFTQTFQAGAGNFYARGDREVLVWDKKFKKYRTTERGRYGVLHVDGRFVGESVPPRVDILKPPSFMRNVMNADAFSSRGQRIEIPANTNIQVVERLTDVDAYEIIYNGEVAYIGTRFFTRTNRRNPAGPELPNPMGVKKPRNPNQQNSGQQISNVETLGNPQAEPNGNSREPLDF
jgi:hypothetical protein